MPASVVLTLLLAQSLPAETGDAANMERIRRQLAETPAIVVPPSLPRDGLVFRGTAHGRKPDTPAWADRSGVPPYVRAPFPSYHFQFLQQVTPEEFRAGTLYPGAIGLPIGTLIDLLVRDVKLAHRKRQETRAREEVRKALEELLACRANPARPGC